MPEEKTVTLLARVNDPFVKSIATLADLQGLSLEQTALDLSVITGMIMEDISDRWEHDMDNVAEAAKGYIRAKA